MELVEYKGVFSLFPESIQDRLKAVPAEYWNKSTEELTEMANPTFNHFQIKKRVWREIKEKQETGDTSLITIGSIVKDICVRGNFYAILDNPALAAWMFMPIQAYDEFMDTMSDYGRSRYTDLVNMDITIEKRRRDGSVYRDVCPKKAMVLLYTIRQIEERSKGKPVEKQITILDKNNGQGKVDQFNMDVVNARIQELEALLGGGNNGDNERKSVSISDEGAIEVESRRTDKGS